MSTVTAAAFPTWRGELALEFERRADRTVLARRHHNGPLLVQKPLYPEGDAVCHAIVLHPPAGIAGGDTLDLQVACGEHAHALLTTPGATRWYRSSGAPSSQRVCIEVESGGCVEWLPQENIVFSGALAQSSLEVHLGAGASFIGWDILCLGRRGSGERFDAGLWRVDNRLHAGDRLCWMEAGRVEGGSVALAARPVLAGASVTATFMAFAPHLAPSVLAPLRLAAQAVAAEHGRAGRAAVSLLPGLLIGRYLGDSSEAARRFFTALWQHARPVFGGRDAREPRIWKT
jgi:urease accessory protein